MIYSRIIKHRSNLESFVRNCLTTLKTPTQNVGEQRTASVGLKRAGTARFDSIAKQRGSMCLANTASHPGHSTLYLL